MTTAEHANESAAGSVVGGAPTEPRVGFVGRGDELDALMKALTAEQPRGPVLLWGYEGVGKTTLAAHAARALQQSGRFNQVTYTRFSGGGLPELARYDVGRTLLGDLWTPSQEDAEQRALEALQRNPTLLIWDQVEALLPGAPGVSSGALLSELLELAERLTGEGGSRVCLIADSATANAAIWGRGQEGVGLVVGGLAQAEGERLLRALLADRGALPADVATEQALVRGLQGHPMALGLVAASAGARTPAELLRELEEILPGFGMGEAGQGNLGLDAAVELWLRGLAEPARLQVLSLAPFVDGLMVPLGGSVRLDERSEWKELAPELVRAQVLVPVTLDGLSVEYAWVAPGITRRMDQRLTESQRSILATKHSGAYVGLLQWMRGHGIQTARTMRDLFRCELPNMRHVASALLGSEHLTEALQFTRQVGSWMLRLGLSGDAERLASLSKAAASAALPQEGPLGRAGVRLLLGQAEQALAGGQVTTALNMLNVLESRIAPEKGLSYGGEEALADRGVILHRLGQCLLTVGQPAEARKRLTGAVELLGQCQPSEQLRRELASGWGRLGDARLAEEHLDEAAIAYGRGLELGRVLEDRRLSGLMQVGLATVAIKRNDDASASAQLHAALEDLAAANDHQGMVDPWQRLALLALRNGDVAQAETAFQEAVGAAQRASDAPLEVQALIELGHLMEAQSRLDEARGTYQRAVDAARGSRRAPLVLKAEQALARVLLASGAVQEAKEHAMEAQALADNLGPQASPWQVYQLLGRIAQAEGNAEREAHWRLAAQESYAASPEAVALVLQWKPLSQAVLEACRGGSLDLGAVEALERLESDPMWGALAGAIWRILEGERGTETYADLDLSQAAVARHIVAELQKG